MRQRSAHFGKEEKPSKRRCDATFVASQAEKLVLRRQEVSPIKEKIISVIQKIVVIILACLMLIGILPIGLMPDNDVEKIGDFIRIATAEELYSSEKKSNGAEKIGRGHCAYLKFNLENIAKTDIDDIKKVCLRLAFLKGSGSLKNEISVSILPNGLWPHGDSVKDFKIPFEKEIAVIYPQTMGAEDSLSEIDITNYVKKYIDEGKTDIAFRLSSKMPVYAKIASGSNSDSAYRPSLKIVTGEAEDTDAYTLRKASVSDAVYVSAMRPEATGRELSNRSTIAVGEGKDIYLKFELNENAIFDSVYKARLSLHLAGTINDGVFNISVINNNQWSGGNITYNSRPRGEEIYATSFETDKEGRMNIDVTQAVCEARTRGIRTIAFRITAENGNAIFYGKGDIKNEPELFIEASDDKDIECASEAAINALGVNSYEFVTMDLPNSYTDESGNTAKLRWTEYDKVGNPISDHISKNGEVKRPRWFESNATVDISAKIQSGDYTTERKYRVIVPAEKAPNYDNYSFGNYIDIGNPRSEDVQKFESVKVSSVKRRWTSGRVFTYRVPETAGAMLLNLACVPQSDNYITLKLWEGDKSLYGNFRLSLCDGTKDSIILTAPDTTEVNNNGFVYATYALPRVFTQGKNFVSLRLEYENPTQVQRETTPKPRGIYAVYMTQTPFFEPKLFANQGEKIVSESSFSESAIRKFIDNLKNIEILSNINDEDATTENASNVGRVSFDSNAGMAVFTGDDLNIAFSVDNEKQSAVIYQKMDYFDRYCPNCPVIYDGDIIMIDYGNYKMIWNKSESEALPIPYSNMEVSGTYREIIDGGYYTFSEDWQMTDDSAFPEGTEVLNGKDIVIQPKRAILLVHIADPMQSSDWRVSHINGVNVSEINLKHERKIDNITVKAVGGIPEGVEEISVISGIYEDSKLISIYKKEVNVTASTDIYTIDFSKDELYIKGGRSLKIFVTDNSESMTEMSPKLELP